MIFEVIHSIQVLVENNEEYIYVGDTTEFINNLNNNDFTQSTCTLDGERILNESKRSSKYYNKKIKLLFDIRDSDNLNISSSYDNVELIKYDVGDKFDKHKDRKISDNHTHTGLLYVPSQYTGGELVLYKYGIKQKIRTCDFNKPVIAIVNLEQYHSSECVNSGVKYVFKFPILSLCDNNSDDEKLED